VGSTLPPRRSGRFYTMSTTAIFTATWNALAEARAYVRLEGKTVRGLCSSIEKIRTHGEQGAFSSVPAEVRILEAEETAASVLFQEGKGFEFARSTSGPWSTYRIGARRLTGGVVTITLRGRNE
jgi:hypothetical protein